MRDMLATTKFMEDANALGRALVERAPGVPGLALIYGSPGLGKTTVIEWLAPKYRAAHMMAKELMTPRWFLVELVEALDEHATPAHYTQALYEQARHLLPRRPLVMIDEIDLVAGGRKIIETIRNLHDETGVPFLFFGDEAAVKMLARRPQVFDRLQAHMLQARPLDQADCATVAEQLCEAKLAECAAAYIARETDGNFRRTVIQLYRAERIAKANSLDIVRAAHLKANGKSRSARPGRMIREAV